MGSEIPIKPLTDLLLIEVVRTANHRDARKLVAAQFLHIRTNRDSWDH